MTPQQGEGGGTKILKVLDGALVRSLDQLVNGYGLISHDDKKLAFIHYSVGDAPENVSLHSLDDGKFIQNIAPNGIPTFSSDNQQIAVAYTTDFFLCRVSDGTRLATWGHPPYDSEGPTGTERAQHVQFSKDGKLLISAEGDQRIRIWATGPPLIGTLLKVYDKEASPVTSLSVSPRYGLFAYVREDGKVVVARVPTFIIGAKQTNNQVALYFAGGTGRYQLQQRTNLLTRSWENIGAPTTLSSITNTVSDQPVFLRVQSLPD